MDDGAQLGRFILVRDIDGRLHALSMSAVVAICAVEDDGSVLLLPGGRVVRLAQDVMQVAGWFSPGR